MPEAIRRAAERSHDSGTAQNTAFDLKPATGHDEPSADMSDILSNLRPSVVQAERHTEGAVSQEVIVESAFHKVTGLTVPMGSEFEKQFMASYIPRAIPWACNYSCGGADFPGLFTDWDMLQEEASTADPSSTDSAAPKLWRRTNGEALLWPGSYAQMLATRPEMQLGGDWMLVPCARNLHWRYEVLRSSFMVCKQRLAADADRQKNVESLVEAMTQLWERISSNVVKIKGVKRPINNNMELLFHDDDATEFSKLILKSYLNTTSHIAGCQALRKKIGHLFQYNLSRGGGG